MKEYFLEEAVKEAKKAFDNGEVPIGAVVVFGDKIIARGYNKREQKRDPTLHAEVEAIKKASKKLNSWRLDDCELYVTLEPCMMCLGTIFNARIKKVYYGASDNSSSVKNLELFKLNYASHKIEVYEKIDSPICEDLITTFFKNSRKKN